MRHTRFQTPSGEEMVILSREDYEMMIDKLDAALHDAAMAAVARGEQEMLTSAEIEAALAASTPLAFWRTKRGITQKALGDAVGASQSYIADLEAGRRKGDPRLILRISRALRVRMEDLVVDDE